MKYKKQKRYGFTLIETLIALTIATTAGVSLIKYQTQEAKNQKEKIFANEINTLIHAIDKRISIDGYAVSLWNKTNWDNNDLKDLIKNQLQGVDSTCKGTWIPQNNEKDLSLVPCNLFDNKKYDMDISSKIEQKNGYINNVIIDYSFKNKEGFDKQFKDFRRSFQYAKANKPKTITGELFYQYINKENGNQLSLKECINKNNLCEFRVILDRQGGTDYIHVDGSNSMIGKDANLSFVDTKGNAPLKCVHWHKTSGNIWKKEALDKCGIGLYGNTPVSVDANIKNATVNGLLLDKECFVYSWNNTTKKIDENRNKIMPCGITKEGSDIIQIVDNVQAETGYFKKIYAENSSLNMLETNNLKSKLINADAITTKSLINNGSTTLNGYTKINNNLDVSGQIRSNLGNITSLTTGNVHTRNAQVDGLLKANNLKTTGLIETTGQITGKNILSNGSMGSKGRMNVGEFLALQKVASVGNSCYPNGLLGREGNGQILNCVNGKWISGMSSGCRLITRNGEYLGNSGTLLVFQPGFSTERDYYSHNRDHTLHKVYSNNYSTTNKIRINNGNAYTTLKKYETFTYSSTKSTTVQNVRNGVAVNLDPRNTYTYCG